jgi:hypothetical protein
MPIITTESTIESSVLQREIEPVTKAYKYYHLTVTEEEFPELATEAWRIHAEGYLAAGFVNEYAITSNGFLADDLDKSRGPNTDYYIALNPDDESDCGTMRKINLPPGGTYRDLPAYQLCSGGMSQIGTNFLASIEQQGTQVKEIAALARTRKGSPIAVHEVFTKALHESIGKNEAWFFSIVSTTHESLARNYGKENFMVVGDDVSINDWRINKDIVLRPVVVQPDLLIDRVLAAYCMAQGRAKFRFLRSFMDITDGLSSEDMSEAAYAARQEILSRRRAA